MTSTWEVLGSNLSRILNLAVVLGFLSPSRQSSKMGENHYKTMNGTSRAEELTEVIQECLTNDQTLSVWMLEEMPVTVHNILVEDLKKRKVSICFVPHLLTLDQKHQCAASSIEFVEMTDDRNILKRIVTGDESWCFIYNPETKCQSATWLSPKKPKAQKV
jgi:hypothetical protein